MSLRSLTVAAVMALLLTPPLVEAAALASASVLHPTASAVWSNLRIRVEDLRPDDGISSFWRMRADAVPGLRSSGTVASLIDGPGEDRWATAEGPLPELELAWSIDLKSGEGRADYRGGVGRAFAQGLATGTYAASEVELCNGCAGGRGFLTPWNMLDLSPHSRLIIEIDAEIGLWAQDNPGELFEGALDDYAIARVGLGAAFATGGSASASLEALFDAQRAPGERWALEERRLLSVSLVNASDQVRAAGFHLSARAEVIDASVSAVPEPAPLSLATIALGLALLRRSRAQAAGRAPRECGEPAQYRIR